MQVTYVLKNQKHTKTIEIWRVISFTVHSMKFYITRIIDLPFLKAADTSSG